MKKIKDYISKPSEAVQAMIDGLLEQSVRPDFEIEMNTYGASNNKICFGCAATCTIQKITNINFIPKGNIFSTKGRAKDLKLIKEDLNTFEYAINDFRAGTINSLFEYFGVTHNFKNYQDWYLSTEDWTKELPKVQKFLKKMIAKGF